VCYDYGASETTRSKPWPVGLEYAGEESKYSWKTLQKKITPFLLSLLLHQCSQLINVIHRSRIKFVKKYSVLWVFVRIYRSLDIPQWKICHLTIRLISIATRDISPIHHRMPCTASLKNCYRASACEVVQSAILVCNATIPSVSSKHSGILSKWLNIIELLSPTFSPSFQFSQD